MALSLSCSLLQDRLSLHVHMHTHHLSSAISSAGNVVLAPTGRRGVLTNPSRTPFDVTPWRDMFPALALDGATAAHVLVGGQTVLYPAALVFAECDVSSSATPLPRLLQYSDEKSEGLVQGGWSRRVSERAPADDDQYDLGVM